ncbi:3-oxoacyl-[acyl-carrier-protein] synthase, mitochondrial-like protein [Drosera capensis]
MTSYPIIRLQIHAIHLIFNPSFPSSPSPSCRHRSGMVTSLGCGVETTWRRLIRGECGVGRSGKRI